MGVLVSVCRYEVSLPLSRGYIVGVLVSDCMWISDITSAVKGFHIGWAGK